ncbi:MAG: SOS response-associated peptidase [Parvularculaceae bacterium]
MCGRYHQTAPPERLGREYDLDIRENFPPRYNVAPGQAIAVIRQNEKGKRQFALMRWGFIPAWAKPEDLKKMGGKPLINARGETVAEKPTFRSAFKRRRCLIPADGFYEWKAERDGKQPYCIRRKDDELFSFAGIWETARDLDGGEIDTAAIITTEAGFDLKSLHNREPVVIAKAEHRRWLETDERDAKDLSALLAAPGKGFWRYFPVSKAVNNARNEGPQLVEPLHDLLG